MKQFRMLGPQHSIAGAVIGGVFGIWLLLLNHPWIAIFTFLISIWAATLPDFIDPPTSPFHRSIGHSFISLFLFGLGFLLFISLSWLTSWWIFIMSSAFTLSFLVHLLLDLTTPAGLPVFFGKTIFGILEIPLYMIPVLNIILIIVTVLLSLYGVYYISKKIGGKLTLLILFIPVWGTLLLVGIALLQISLLNWLSILVFLLFFAIIAVLLSMGHLIDMKIKKNPNIQK